jgi:hypothetical protein
MESVARAEVVLGARQTLHYRFQPAAKLAHTGVVKEIGEDLLRVILCDLEPDGVIPTPDERLHRGNASIRGGSERKIDLGFAKGGFCTRSYPADEQQSHGTRRQRRGVAITL